MSDKMVLHMMAVVQLRNPTEGRAYYNRKMAAGKSPNEAMRGLKRRFPPRESRWAWPHPNGLCRAGPTAQC